MRWVLLGRRVVLVGASEDQGKEQPPRTERVLILEL